MIRRLVALAAVALLLVAPLALRPRTPATREQQVLVIISPHDSQTRLEFGRAFAEWAERERHVGVSIDWRTPGGTNVIRKTIASAVRLGLSDAHRDWSDEQLDAAVDARIDRPDAHATEAARAARAAYLASDIGCGVDLWWGGGPQPHRECAEAGYSVDAGLVRELPEWFTDTVIPETITGERVYDAGGRWYATCFSAFGIAASADRLALLPDTTQPRQWLDLGDPRFFAGLTMVDPTKSGASNSALEMLIQQRMSERVARTGENPAALAAGWDDAFTLIKRIAGNCRAVTDGASVSVREVAHGDAIASMALDFQARVEAAYALEQSQGMPRLVFALPVGGTSISPDPISLLRGAKQRQLAVDFIRFALSPAGQRLYSYRLGEPGGPQRYELNRMPIRKDVYTAEDRMHMSAPDLDPYAVAGTFVFHRQWTQPAFSLIATMTRAVVLDPREELVAAWRAIIDAGGPERVPEAWTRFTWLPVAHGDAAATATRLAKDPVGALAETRRWTVEAQRRYREAEGLARAAAGGAR